VPGLLWYIVGRLLWSCVLFLGVSVVTFVLFFVAPHSPERAVCGGNSAQTRCMEEAAHRLRLDRPLYYQYGLFLKRLVVDRSLGTSFKTRQSVNQIVGQAAPVTASLVFGGAILWLGAALLVGIFSALRPRSLFDRVGMVLVLIGVSAHPVWIGLIFSYFFGYKLRNFPIHTPIAGYADFFNPPPGHPGGPVEWAYHLILPWCTFAILFAALYARMIRANVMETMNEDFVRTARAKGAPESRVLRTHVLRNALLPVVTMLGMDIGLALGGAVFIESVYDLPGLGQTAVIAVTYGDLAILEGIVLFATLAIIVFNLLVDILYAWVDPRIRLT
jgi:peptide/nickel transport system permease protein